MNFSDALASSIHDIKNSLSLVLNNLDEVLNDPHTHIGNLGRAKVLKLETQRANANLIQLLSLYKLDKQQLAAELLEYNVEDFLDELLAENQQLMQALGIDLETDCDPLDSGYFDENLVRGVLNSVIGNAERYTDSRILISAANEDGYLVFRIEDDGPGFPQHMLSSQSAQSAGDAFRSGHTQLGLYFAAEVARLHRNGERSGFIRLRNRHRLSGGCFELWLP